MTAYNSIGGSSHTDYWAFGIPENRGKKNEKSCFNKNSFDICSTLKTELLFSEVFRTQCQRLNEILTENQRQIKKS